MHTNEGSFEGFQDESTTDFFYLRVSDFELAFAIPCSARTVLQNTTEACKTRNHPVACRPSTDINQPEETL